MSPYSVVEQTDQHKYDAASFKSLSNRHRDGVESKEFPERKWPNPTALSLSVEMGGPARPASRSPNDTRQ